MHRAQGELCTVPVVIDGLLTCCPPARCASLPADLLRAVRQGELCTWAKLSAIQCNCGIEATLDACIQQVGTVLCMLFVIMYFH
jgi:hypothetical protein